MASQPCMVPTPSQGWPWARWAPCQHTATTHKWLCGSTEGLSVTMTIQQGHFPRCHSASQPPRLAMTSIPSASRDCLHLLPFLSKLDKISVQLFAFTS